MRYDRRLRMADSVKTLHWLVLLQRKLHVPEAVAVRSVYHLHSAVQQNRLDLLRPARGRYDNCTGLRSEDGTTSTAVGKTPSCEVEWRCIEFSGHCVSTR